jgi:hypothetical protein
MYAAFVELQVGAWILSWLRIDTTLHLVRDMGTKQQSGFKLAGFARRPRPTEAMRSLARMQLPARQRGAFLLLLLALVSSVVIYVVVSGLNLSAGALARAQDQKTSTALAQAREALIGYATMGSTRPGSLPCPDTSNNGDASSFATNECPSCPGALSDCLIFGIAAANVSGTR